MKSNSIASTRHPNLRVEFIMSDQYVDLTRGDADVALRSGDTDDDVLVGRKIPPRYGPFTPAPPISSATANPGRSATSEDMHR